MKVLRERLESMDRVGMRWFLPVGLAILLAAGWLMAFPLRQTMDIFFSEESGYLSRAVHMFPMIPGNMAPLYSFWYRALSWIQPDTVNLFFLNFGLLSVLFPMVLFLFLLRIHIAPPLALLLAFLVMISPMNITSYPKVSHFTLIVAMSGILVAFRLRQKVTRTAFLALVFLVLSYIRPEYYIVFLLLTGAAMVYVWKHRHWRIQWNIPLAIAAVVGILHLAGGIPLVAEIRNHPQYYPAFGEHFSYNYSTWYQSRAFLWLAWEEVTQETFGEVRYIATAAMANPEAMLRHLGHNLLAYVQHTGMLAATTVFPFMFVPPNVLVALPLVLLFLLLLPAARKRFLYRMRKKGTILALLLLLALPSWVASILIYPRDHYLVMQWPLIVWILAELVTAAAAMLPDLRAGRVLTVTSVLLLLALYFIDPRRPDSYDYFDVGKLTGRQNNLVMLSFLDQYPELFESSRILSHEGDFTTFTKTGINYIDARNKEERTFSSFLHETAPDVIYCTENMFKSPYYMEDLQWNGFLQDAEIGGSGWHIIPVYGGRNDLLIVKEEIYEKLDYRASLFQNRY